ncbi:helix-turn-helix transcriptional regulator [Desulfovibrio sp. JC010]|uniref:helix-turn-helix domain-containing protein n=1 Tax=Desulfovibrio sp. JC010 TaxID=2593641 RepID=UPI0023B2BADD|nr:helix-turn-helix transcriptional regulator [Desulfovibrio sp. JC010]
MDLELKSNLPELMEKAQISIRVLADKCGLAVETISRARDERIASCRLDTLCRIAQELGCSVDELYSVDFV